MQSKLTWRRAVSEYQIGSTMQYKDREWRIVRVIYSDTTLFEDESGAYLIKESYLQLKSIDGEIDHYVLESEKLSYGEPSHPIKGLNPIIWRRS